MAELRRLKKGDVVRYSWGYDQTNVDAFEVVRESPKSVWIQAIATKQVPGSGGFMSAKVVPVRGSFLTRTFMGPNGPETETAKPIVKRRKVNWKGEEEILHMDFGVATLWPDGSEAYESWYA